MLRFGALLAPGPLHARTHVEPAVYRGQRHSAHVASARDSPSVSGVRGYLLIIFRLVAAIVSIPPLSLTSPVSSTLWLMWGTSLALLLAARSPVTV